MMKIYYFIWQIITKSFLSVSLFTTEVPVEKSLFLTIIVPFLQINTDCKTMEPQKPGGNRKMVVCEHVDRFMRQPTGL